jgi:hypothetical protein
MPRSTSIAENLGHALLADLQEPGDRLLGDASSMRRANLLVASTPEYFSRLVELRLALCEILGEGR